MTAKHKYFEMVKTRTQGPVTTDAASLDPNPQDNPSTTGETPFSIENDHPNPLSATTNMIDIANEHKTTVQATHTNTGLNHTLASHNTPLSDNRTDSQLSDNRADPLLDNRVDPLSDNRADQTTEGPLGDSGSCGEGSGVYRTSVDSEGLVAEVDAGVDAQSLRPARCLLCVLDGFQCESFAGFAVW